jgi:multidrug resistance efflux pump
LVQAAERRLGCYPRRRIELIHQRLRGCEQAIQAVLQQTTSANERVAHLAVRIERLNEQMQAAEAQIQTLRIQPASRRQAGPYSQLNRLIKQQMGWQVQRTRAQAQLTQAAAVAERHRQRLVAEAQTYELERQRLQARYARCCAENAAQPNPPRCRIRLDARAVSCCESAQ